MTEIDANLEEAQRAYKEENFDDAAKKFEEIARLLNDTGDAPRAAEMKNNASVAWLRFGDAQAALRCAEGTAAVFAAAGDLQKQGMALGNLAAALEALGDIPAAIDSYQQSADLFKQSGDRDLRATVLQSLSSLQMRRGKQMEAMATMQTALDQKPKLNWREKFLQKLLKVPFKMLNR
ncbi:MAG: tetratricopeptide repeat protein [Anaerolineaceae bacterium]